MLPAPARKGLLSVLIVVTGAAVCACAQTLPSTRLERLAPAATPMPPAPTELPNRDVPSGDVPGMPVISSNVNEVQLSFTAMQRGRFVPDLKPEELQLLDNEKPPAHITSFWRNENLALRVAVVVDVSGSVSAAFRTEQKSAIQFVSNMLRQPGDQAALLSFTQTPRLVQGFTSDRDSLGAAIKAMKATSDGTAVFDSVRFACRQLVRGGETGPLRRAIVLITDGDDNASQASLEDAIRTAQNDDVMVYVIQVNVTFNSSQPKVRQAVKELARETGGKMYEADGGQHFAPAFRKIEAELRSQYVMTYTPAAWHSDGAFRRIKLRAHRSGVHLQCRPGYYTAVARAEPEAK